MGISLSSFIYPYFVVEGRNKKQRIKSFPGVFRFSIDKLLVDIKETAGLGIEKILLFGIPGYKDDVGSSGYSNENIVARAVREIKKEFPELIVMTDVCLCAYTSHGHCGIVKSQKSKGKSKNGVLLDNSQTLKILSKVALTHAKAGADWVAPSAMAKGQVRAIRKALDKNGFSRTRIMGYSAKFASNFYGPFRDAADSAPKFGDRKAYQLDYSRPQAALKEIAGDIKEGADIVMVKPALSYLDLISRAKEKFSYPLAAYNVSGEYSMVKLGARQGLWD
ncbi:MAG: porphobilinogen synthase, partial [Candidatus Omnitrophota bacterium]|nr:porphobilinogen synthase [Candidatus Omnitrophota bacterium]